MARYSHSRLNSYQNCPKSFLWHYVWNVRPPVEGVEAFVGKRVHETLEGLYLQVIENGTPPPLASLLRDYNQLWDHHWTGDVRIVKDQPAAHYRELGVQCLERYYRSEHPFRSGATVGIEKSFEFAVEPGSTHLIRGIIDRIDIADDGAVEVHDYKTGRRVPSQQTLAADLQVGLYEVAARVLYPEHRRVRMVWHYLQSGVRRRVPSRDPDELASLRRYTSRRIDEIETRVESYRAGLPATGQGALKVAPRAAVTSVQGAARQESPLFPARVSPLCRWCGFLSWCEQGSRHADLPFRPPAPPPEPPPAPPPPRVDSSGQARLF